MEKTVADNINDFFCDSLSSGDRESAIDFISDYFCCQEDDGKWNSLIINSIHEHNNKKWISLSKDTVIDDDEGSDDEAEVLQLSPGEDEEVMEGDLTAAKFENDHTYYSLGGGVTSEEPEEDDSNGNEITPTYKLLTITFSHKRANY